MGRVITYNWTLSATTFPLLQRTITASPAVHHPNPMAQLENLRFLSMDQIESVRPFAPFNAVADLLSPDGSSNGNSHLQFHRNGFV